MNEMVWSKFIALEENKADLARFLSEIIVTKCYDLYQNNISWYATDVRSTSEVKRQGNPEETAPS